MKHVPLSVDMVKDPTRVKSRFIGSFTKRQIVCYGIAALIGIPFYLFTKDAIGKETAALFMVALMFPPVIASMYEKDGLPAEKYFIRFVRWRFLRPMKRVYKKENRFERMEKRKQMETEVAALEHRKGRLTLKEYLRKRELKLLISGKKKEKGKGISSQQTITFKQMSPDGICLVKDGYYTGMIEFADTNYKILDERERMSILRNYSQMLNSFPSDMDIQIFLFSRRRDRREMMERLDVPLRGDEHDFLREEYTQLLKKLFATSTSGITKNRYLILGVKAPNIRDARFRITEKAKEIIQDLSDMRSEARLLNGEERIQLLYEFFNQDKIEDYGFSYEDMQKTGDSFKDYFVPHKMDFSEPGIVKADGRYISTKYLSLDCAKVDETLMESLAEQHECFSVSIHMQTIEPGEALRMAKNALVNSQSAKITQQKKAFDTGVDSDIISSTVVEEEKNAHEILRNLNETNQKLIRTTFLITAFGKTRKETEAIHERVLSKFKGIGCKVFPLKHSQETALNAAAPIGICSLNQPRIVLTNDMGIFAPFRTWELFQDGDFIYYGLNTLSENLILGDRKQLENPNGLIIGIPGSGKSFAAKREILGTYTCTMDDIIICDPEGEYFPLVKALGGTVVKLATTSKDHLNPLDINYDHQYDKDSLKTKSVFVLTLCECLAGGKFGLESDERGIIDSCLNIIYEKFFINPLPENMPTLESLYDALIDYTPNFSTNEELIGLARKKAMHLANSLVLYVHGSQNYFNNRTNVDSNNRVICFDIRDLGSELKNMGMLVVQDAVWNRVSRNRERKVSTRYYCDEFHLLLRDSRTAEYCSEIWKRFRKWGGIPTGITQNVNDLLQTEKVQTILSTSEFIYILKQKDNDKELLKEKIGLSPAELEYVLDAQRGSGILCFGNKKLSFADDYPKDTRSYEMMTTKFGEGKKETDDEQ